MSAWADKTKIHDDKYDDVRHDNSAKIVLKSMSKITKNIKKNLKKVGDVEL